MTDDDRRRGYPDVEQIDEDEYWVTIPVPGDRGEGQRGPAHNGGTISLYLTEAQLNEWVNKFAQEVDR